MAMVVLWIVAALIVLLILVWYSDVRIQGHFSRVGENDHINIHVKALYGIIRFQYVIPVIKFQGLKGLMIEREKNLFQREDRKEWIDKGKIMQFFENTKLMIHHTHGLTDWAKQTFKHVKCTELRWTTRVGLPDAPDTAILTGAIWALKSNILHLTSKFMSIETQPKLHVFPLYNRTHFSTEVIATTHIRAGTVLFAGLKLLPRIKKAKNGFQAWRKLLIKPSSS